MQKFENELVDRFQGNLTKEAINLLKSVELKWLASEIGLINCNENGIFLGYFQIILKINSIKVKNLEILLLILVKILEAQLKEKSGKKAIN